jgi:hypothetical protein
MKNWKNLASLVVGVSMILIYSNCTKKSRSFFEQVSDGYILTANEELLKNVQDNSDYGVTFIDLGGQKTVDRDVIKNALSDSSKYCTLEGRANKVGGNKLKITTDSKLTVDLKRPFATFWGVNFKQIGDFLSGGHSAANCSGCGGISDMKQVTCTDPASVLCCTTCP